MANEQRVSRRRWMMAGSASAAAMALLPGRSGAAETAATNLSGARVFNVRDHGASGDGTTLDTAAIQAAIDDCDNDRGGTVLIPAGTFLVGPIELKSNVTLHISAGATLLATTDVSQYHPAKGIPLQGDHTMGDGNVGLIYAANADNVTIEGNGTIDGQGAQVRAAGLSGNRRCHLVLFYKCANLKIRDVYMYRSGYHTCRICNCSHVHLDGIRINSRVTGNNDGFHFISAEFVNMTNCNVRCQDDACALFGSCRFIMITNCFFSTRWSVFRFGGGIAENVTVSNCVMDQVYGCPIKLRCQPGSRYENMLFSNLVFKDVTGPISVGSGPQRPPSTSQAAAEPPREAGGIVRNISFAHITGNVITRPQPLDDSTFAGSNNPGEMHSAIILNAVDGGTIENITLSDIHLTFGGGGSAGEAARRELPQIANEYFSLGAIPAYGLYARNVRGLTVSDVRFEVASPELRPAVMLDRVHDASMFGLSAQGNAQAESLLRLMNCADVVLSSPRVLKEAAVFLRVEGEKSDAITINGGDVKRAQRTVEFADGAAQSAVKVPM